MSLDVYLYEGGPDVGQEVYTANVTHNLDRMARACGLYVPLWRPEEIEATHASALIEPLRDGLARLLVERDQMEEFNPTNGWGDYDLLVRFTDNYLTACEENPQAEIEVWR